MIACISSRKKPYPLVSLLFKFQCKFREEPKLLLIYLLKKKKKKKIKCDIWISFMMCFVPMYQHEQGCLKKSKNCFKALDTLYLCIYSLLGQIEIANLSLTARNNYILKACEKEKDTSSDTFKLLATFTSLDLQNLLKICDCVTLARSCGALDYRGSN